jgi:alpha-galactosidase
MSETTREILTATEVIAVDQDPAGMPGRLLREDGGCQIWARRLADGSHVVVLLNTTDAPATMYVSWAELGLRPSTSAVVRDLWSRQDVANLTERYETTVRPHEARMLKLAQ